MEEKGATRITARGVRPGRSSGNMVSETLPSLCPPDNGKPRAPASHLLSPTGPPGGKSLVHWIKAGTPFSLCT